MYIEILYGILIGFFICDDSAKTVSLNLFVYLTKCLITSSSSCVDVCDVWDSRILRVPI